MTETALTETVVGASAAGGGLALDRRLMLLAPMLALLPAGGLIRPAAAA